MDDLMQPEDIAHMAREAGWWTLPRILRVRLERFAQLVAKKAVEAAVWERHKRRGVLLFNPYSGKPRHPSDIDSDPHGILMLDPDEPLRVAR